MTEIKIGDVVRVRGFSGIACRFVGHPVEQDEMWDDEAEEYVPDEHVRADQAIVVMVGDDHRHTVDMDDLSPLPRRDYCGECGQIGCAHDGLDRDEEDEED
jgi:hypothetical protein